MNEEPTWGGAFMVIIGFILFGLVMFGVCDQRGGGSTADDRCIGSQVFC